MLSSILILPEHFRQSDSNAESPDTAPKAISSSRRVAENEVYMHFSR